MKLILITDKNFQGEIAQSQGIKNAIEKKEGRSFETITIECSELSSFLKEIQPEESLIIASGLTGLEATNFLKKHFGPQRIKVVWSGHLFFDKFKDKDIKYFPDIIALPKSVITKEIEEFLRKKTLLVKTQGVPHTLTDKTVIQDVQNFKGKLPDTTGKRVIAIMLSGDAPLPDGKTIRFFTKESAEETYDLIIAHENKKQPIDQDTLFLVTNAPRTGLYDISTSKPKEPSPHRTGKVDEISQAFIDQLKKHNVNFIFYDYQFPTNAENPSAYKPMIQKVCDSKGIFYIPSASTSMVIEASYISRKGGNVTIYRSNTSENDDHVSHLMDAYHYGGIGILEKDGTFLPPKPIELNNELASDQIASFCSFSPEEQFILIRQTKE